MSDDDFDGPFDDDFEGIFDGDPYDGVAGLPAHESWQVGQDLDDLEAMEQVFAAQGFLGVSMWCQDCDEEHFHRWELLRNSLETLLETGEIPVHEPALDPDPAEYVPWEYARGYVDALRDVGVDQRVPVGACPRCGLSLEGPLETANWCPRCAAPLLGARLEAALDDHGLGEDEIADVLRAVGLPLQ